MLQVEIPYPFPSEFGTHKTVKARFRPCLEPFYSKVFKNFNLFASRSAFPGPSGGKTFSTRERERARERERKREKERERERGGREGASLTLCCDLSLPRFEREGEYRRRPSLYLQKLPTAGLPSVGPWIQEGRGKGGEASEFRGVTGSQMLYSD